MVRSLDGIPAVLGACGPNHVNQIRNWAIQTINQVEHPYFYKESTSVFQLCWNNLENQKAIEELEKIRDISNRDVSVDRDENGKYHFKRISQDG